VLIGLRLVVIAIWTVGQAGFSRTTVEDSAAAILKRRFGRGQIDHEKSEHRFQKHQKA
jgi:uncharacterized membrane protein